MYIHILAIVVREPFDEMHEYIMLNSSKPIEFQKFTSHTSRLEIKILVAYATTLEKPFWDAPVRANLCVFFVKSSTNPYTSTH